MSYDPASVPPPPPAPSPYAAPAQPTGPAGAPPTGRVNGLGIAALAVGAVGLIIAFVPFIGALGGFLGFVGLVLGIIGLVLKGRKKGLAIAGTIVSGVALIASIVMIFVYTASYINAFNDAVEGERPSVIDEAPPAEGEEDAEGIEPGGVGSRENPAPIGSTVSIEAITGAAWEVSLGAPTLNATDLVKAASEYNPDPAAGNQYAIVPATITNVGDANGTPFELTFEFVDAEGRSYAGGYVSMEGQLTDVDELLPGASATGNVVIEIPSAGAEAGTWAVAYIMGDPIYFAAQ